MLYMLYPLHLPFIHFYLHCEIRNLPPLSIQDFGDNCFELTCGDSTQIKSVLLTPEALHNEVRSSRLRYVKNNGRWEHGRERDANPHNLLYLFIHSVVSILYNIVVELQMVGSTVSVLGSLHKH